MKLGMIFETIFEPRGKPTIGPSNVPGLLRNKYVINHAAGALANNEPTPAGLVQRFSGGWTRHRIRAETNEN
jgi:hypothetical protein